MATSPNSPTLSEDAADQPPIPAAPGPRATALTKLYNDAISHILKTISYPNFASCFPTPAREVPGSLKLLHEQFREKLGESMRREFEGILEEREVVRGLNGVDGMVDVARARKEKALSEGTRRVVPPHTLPAEQLYQAHVAPSLVQYHDELATRQEGLQTENAQLLERVMQQRRDIEALVKGLENVVGTLDASVASLQGDEANLEGLKEQAQDVDERMRPVA